MSTDHESDTTNHGSGQGVPASAEPIGFVETSGRVFDSEESLRKFSDRVFEAIKKSTGADAADAGGAEGGTEGN